MPSSINPIKEAKVRRSLLAGKSARQALRDAGYKEGSVSHSTDMPVIKRSMNKIADDIKSKITVEYILNKLNKEVLEAKNSADRIRATELLGKYLAMFKETNLNYNQDSITQEDKLILSKYINPERLSKIPVKDITS